MSFSTDRLFSRISVACVLIFSVAAFSKVGATPQVLNKIRAVVNGEPITQMEVDSAVRTQVQVWLMGNKGMVSRSAAESEIRKMEERALDDMIDRKLILSEFKKLGGEIKSQYVDDAVNRFITSRFGGDKDKFLEELKKSGMSIAQFRDVQQDQMAIQVLRQQKVGDDPIPNLPWEKKKKYEEIKGEHASEGQVKLRMISIPKMTDDKSMDDQKALVESVRAKLRNGSDFGDVAKEHSADSFASKGGYVGVIGKNTLNPNLTQAAYSMPSGTISPPIDDGPFWRIMKVDGRVGQKVPSYEDLEEEVDKLLTIEKRQEKLDEWLDDLRRDANVRIYE